MKKVMVFLGIMLFVITGCGDDQEINHDHVVMGKIYFEPGTEKPFNGERTFYYDSGEIRTEATYVDGYPELVTHFDRDQQKVTELRFDKDKMEGMIEWYRSGQKKFEMGERFIKEWYKNGQLKSETNLNEDGDLHGKITVWYQDGTVEGIEHYRNGQLHGERIWYDTTGAVVKTEEFRDGNRVK